MSFERVSPILVVDDETGEWVMTHNITRVAKDPGGGSLVYVRSDIANGGNYSNYSYLKSPLSPGELRERMFNPGELE